MRSKKYTEMEEGKQGASGSGVDSAKAEGLKKSNAPKKPKKKMKTWKKVLIVILVLVVAGCGGAYAWVNQKLNSSLVRENIDKKDLSCVDVDGYVNILLLGVDSRSMSKKALESANTDCIIIVSLNTKTNKINLISVYRDTYLPVGNSKYGKINSAMAIDGPTNTIKSLNESLDLNIDNYALFNWKMVADLVDEVGGVQVNVSEDEMNAMNQFLAETADYCGRDSYTAIQKTGKQKLDGVQAVVYGRIRKGVGDDYKRTDRMRLIIKKTLNKLKKEDVSTLLDVMDICLKNCKTSLSNNDLIGLAQRLASYKINKSVGFPYTIESGTYNGASYVFPTDLENDVIKLHEEMFGQKNYEPTDRVSEIASRCYSAYTNRSSDQTYFSEESGSTSSYGSSSGSYSSGSTSTDGSSGYSDSGTSGTTGTADSGTSSSSGSTSSGGTGTTSGETSGQTSGSSTSDGSSSGSTSTP